jgi:predicted deacetylase
MEKYTVTKYLFRMDDICPTMSNRRFAAFEKLFKANDIRPLIGIVPDNRDSNLDIDSANPNFWGDMRSLVKDHGWSVSQHGDTHVYETRDGGLLNINANSEFSGLPYEVQRAKLEHGAAILKGQGLATDIFMAPSHSYDHTTLKALVDTGFKTVTDGYSFYPYRKYGLNFVPCQSGRPREFPFGVVTIAIHANTTTDDGLAAYDTFITRQKHNILPSDAIRKMPYGGRLQQLAETANLKLRALANSSKRPKAKA